LTVSSLNYLIVSLIADSNKIVLKKKKNCVQMVSFLVVCWKLERRYKYIC